MSVEKSIAVDVAIVGSGGAGLAAAIEAKRAGASVAMIEKTDTLGGAAILSGGGCLIAGSPLQEKQGIHDSPDLAFEDWVIWGQGAADESWARYYLDHSLHDLYLWAERLGVTWESVRPQEGNRVRRWHRPKNAGLGITTVLIEAARKLGVDETLTSTAASEILRRDGRVCGLKAVNTHSGEELEIHSRSLILATGGFNSNLDMILAARPELNGSRILLGGGPGATGEGHALARDLGAQLTHMEHIWFYAHATPDYRDPGGKRGLVFRMEADTIWVNQQGRRFHDESLYGGNSATPALLRQSPRHAWAILDTPMVATVEVADPYYRSGAKINRERIQELLDLSPFIRKALSLEELARKMEIDVPTFLATVERHNKACADGLEREAEFGKSLKDSRKIGAPPYYAIQMFPLARKNFGGIRTDMKCRVLDRGLAPIRGLYAAGEVSGMAGGHINGKAGLEGTMLGPSIFSGRVAGAWAAQEAGFGAGFKGDAAGAGIRRRATA